MAYGGAEPIAPAGSGDGALRLLRHLTCARADRAPLLARRRGGRLGRRIECRFGHRGGRHLGHRGRRGLYGSAEHGLGHRGGRDLYDSAGRSHGRRDGRGLGGRALHAARADGAASLARRGRRRLCRRAARRRRRLERRLGSALGHSDLGRRDRRSALGGRRALGRSRLGGCRALCHSRRRLGRRARVGRASRLPLLGGARHRLDRRRTLRTRRTRARATGHSGGGAVRVAREVVLDAGLRQLALGPPLLGQKLGALRAELGLAALLVHLGRVELVEVHRLEGLVGALPQGCVHLLRR
mmetsp:Transcript_5862/g.15321  ORF Transcript_5862/g.15321 Transcript_5862/m.15321 type:complete len:298 (-) Transcript_5862:531-1424(-)